MGSHQPIRKIVTPEIPDKLYFRIGDVAKLCAVPAYVLRFWETEFPNLKPNKGGTGQRLYRKRDVEMALRIKSLLYDQGYTIPGARQVFKTEAKTKDFPVETTDIAQPAQPFPVESRGSDLHRDIQIQSVRNEMRALLSILSRPVSPSHPSAKGKVKAMRPRLVLEPKPDAKPTTKPDAAEPRLLQLKQRDLFGDETAELQMIEPESFAQSTPPPATPAEVPPAADVPAVASLGAAPQTATRPSRFGFFGLSHKHTARSAALLLGFFALVSRAIGLVRDKYIAFTFGAGAATDAYNIAFNLPDLVNYLLIGGAASISFVTILSRYREQGRDEEGEIALSIILNTMTLVLGSALLLAEFLVPFYIRIYSKYDPAQDALAVYMTRILLPGQIFFFAGGVLASVALVRKQFAYQAISPLVYTLGIIVGGLLGAHWLGIPSLAWGALAGTFFGPFLVNAFAARKAGVHYRPILDFHNEGLRDWIKMSLPMMLGVTVVFMDTQILQYFAKHETGDISRLMNAKKLFTAPMAIIGQAAGSASLPFFATLYSREKHEDFRNSVNRSVTRIFSVGVLLSAAIFGLARPLCDLVLRGGHYTRADAVETALFLSIFSLSLALWSSQAIYIRAFYAAGQTLPPMLAGTIITVVSLPFYWGLHARFGVIGLAWASNLAIFVHTLTLAILLHKRYLVPLQGLDRKEIARAIAAAAVAAAAILAMVHLAPRHSGYFWDVGLLAAGCVIWAALSFGMLRLTGSSLPLQLLRRRSA